MYILYYKNKRNKNDKLKMRGFYKDEYTLLKFGCSKSYKFDYYFRDKNDKTLYKIEGV